MKPRTYRTRLEILQDFLGAVRETGKKTRIIGRANLNPSSFQPYLDFCLALELVQDTPAGYQLTPRAGAVLEVTQRLLARSAEVDAALLDLHRGFNGSKPVRLPTKGALRYVSILAWNEVVRSVAETAALETGRSGGRRTFDLPTTETPPWFDHLVAPEPEGSVLANHIMPEADPPPRRRPVRTRAQE
jgi:predicted transcriptional regulator